MTSRDAPTHPRTSSPLGEVRRLPGRPVFPDAEVEDALRRIERSAGMRQSTQLKRLLRHLVVNAQADAEHALREIAVGVEALGRSPSTFDPRTDPIVRTEARRLRAKLADYYAGAGRDDPLVIEVPKGGYLPVLRRNSAPIDAASVAVLPFVNFTGDASREAFCDALTDEVIDALARIDALRVVARTSAFHYKGRAGDARTIASELGAAMLLEGSVQVAGARVRVIAQLVLGRNGGHLWSQAFEAPASELTAMQIELADEIVRAMERGGALASAAAARWPSGPQRGTRDPDARDRYDRAAAILRTLDVSRYDRARELLNEALACDPQFARAHHLLAVALANSVAMCAQPAVEAMPVALAHLAAALELDAGFAQARALYAWIVGVWDRDWPRSLAELRRAVRDGPGHFPVRNTAGNLLALHGRFDEAEAEFALARDLDPLHLVVRYNAALAASYARRFALAIERCDAILDVEPWHPAAGLRVVAQIASGDAAGALAAARRIVVALPDNPTAMARLAEALAANGDVATGLRVLKEAGPTLAAAGAVHWAEAHVHAVAKDRNATFAALDRACAARESNTEATPVDPYFTFLHDDPRWAALVQRHRLPPVAPFAG